MSLQQQAVADCSMQSQNEKTSGTYEAGRYQSRPPTDHPSKAQKTLSIRYSERRLFGRAREKYYNVLKIKATSQKTHRI